MRVGAIDKSLWVVGDRVWVGERPSEPAPFERLPLTWRQAYGGDGFAANPHGKGASAQDSVHLLPNVEDPRQLLDSPMAKAMPAGFGAYESSWPQRNERAGTYDEEWFRTTYPSLPDDVDLRMFNVAPEDQRIVGMFRGDEEIALENLHPTRPILTGRLPGLRARAFVAFKRAPLELVEAPSPLETIWLVPHEDRAILIYRAVFEVSEDDASDVANLLVGAELAGGPRQVDHYEGVLRKRLDRRDGVAAVLNESDLLPASLIEPMQFQAESLQITRARKRAEKKIEAAMSQLRAELEKRGLADRMPSLPVVEQPPADIGEAIQRARAMADRAVAEASARRENALAAVRAQLAVKGLALPDEIESGVVGPPRFNAKRQVAHLREIADRARRAGKPALELERRMDGGDLLRDLERAESALRDAYMRTGHEGKPQRRIDAERAARCRELVLEAHRSHEPLAGHDLTGVDLSGLDLEGVDLRGAFLEAARCQKTKLRDAKLAGAMLARADLSGAELAGADLSSANLGGARLRGAALAGARLDKAILTRADLTNADLRRVFLSKTMLLRVALARADLSGATSRESHYVECDLTNAVASEGDFGRSTFIETTVDGADFEKASLERTTFVKVSAVGAKFRSAQMVRFVAAKETSLRFADFRKAVLSGANMRACDLSRTKLNSATMNDADLSECDLTEASLAHARAEGARFVRAILRGVDARGCNLREAILQNARIESARIEDANLFRADMARVRVDGATSLERSNTRRTRIHPLWQP
jgi:uncharacterized protein YjbI with pentapeptide repeats